MRVVVKISKEYVDLMGWQPLDFGVNPSLCSPDLISYCKKEAIKCGMALESTTGMFPHGFRSLERIDANVFMYEVTGPSKGMAAGGKAT